MSRYHSYLATACLVLEQYSGAEPFPSFLKKFFSRNKKYGSKDRKQIAHLCYCYFRLGKSKVNLELKEKILTGLFLCYTETNEMLSALKPVWNKSLSLPLKDKLSALSIQPSTTSIFPWKDELSDGIDHEKFCAAFFVQPDLFLRIRPGFEKTVLNKLKAEGLTLKASDKNCLQLPNSTKIDDLVEIDKEAVIQDYNSQQTGVLLKNIQLFQRSPDGSTSNVKPKVWDCCAGSGGKSIMLYDIFPEMNLTVSDVRESILFNLKKRFEKAGISHYQYYVKNLAEENHTALPLGGGEGFNIILADVPCTGSGTWGRTPEQLYFFDEKKIEEYSSLQKKILTNVARHLKRDGQLIYITCSVFKKENEDVVKFLQEKSGLKLNKMELLKGYDKKADSMFIAILTA